MDRLKTFAKYVLWIVAFYIFTRVCTFVGFNAIYRDITLEQNLPEQVRIELAQSTKVNGRIRGEITSNSENNLKGKYIKVQIYTEKGNYAGTKYLKIEEIQPNETKKFAVNFKAENIKKYTVELSEDNEKTREEAQKDKELFKEIFTDEETKPLVIIALILGLAVIQ